MNLADTVSELESELETLADDTSDIARMRRITINNGLADALYGLSDILKRQGRNAEADEAHSRANAFWGRVVEEASDLKRDEIT